MLLAVLVITMLTTTALAVVYASYEGAIWTGKPTALGIGYYCTAAQNKSGGDTSTHWAWAKTYYSGTNSYDYQTGNTRAVASSGSVKPTSGRGQYGETGWESDIGVFKASAWD